MNQIRTEVHAHTERNLEVMGQILKSKPSLIVVGAGFFGLTVAENFAREFDLPTLVIEKRSHIGGNAYSYLDPSSGVEIHKYGSHLFHTSNAEVWKYVNQFSSFNNYIHTVMSLHDGQYFPIPINLQTISQIFGKALTPIQAREAIDYDVKSQHLRESPATSFETKALETIGPRLYEALIRGYTSKQWQTPASSLPAEVFSRLPVRFDFNNRYFDDTWEGLPIDGYGKLFEKMVSHPKIEVHLETDYFKTDWFNDDSVLTVYTGPVDRFWSYQHGALKWRTVDFALETHELDFYQGSSIVNYPDLEFDFTRIHEFKHLHPERAHVSGKTVIAKEYSRSAGVDDEPYYPVNTAEDRARLLLYRKLAAGRPNTIFGGRLGSYLYLDMHMAISSALAVFRNVIHPKFADK
jgi:UDP-galactopyranose mutase